MRTFSSFLCVFSVFCPEQVVADSTLSRSVTQHSLPWCDNSDLIVRTRTALCSCVYVLMCSCVHVLTLQGLYTVGVDVGGGCLRSRGGWCTQLGAVFRVRIWLFRFRILVSGFGVRVRVGF